MIRFTFLFLLCGALAIGAEPTTRLVKVEQALAGYTDSETPIFSGGNFAPIRASSRILTSIPRQADGSFWRWSPPADYHSAAVRVFARKGMGSGVVLAVDRGCVVLTNHHVIESGGPLFVSWQGGGKVPATLFAWRHKVQEDIAALYVENPPSGYVGLPISSREPPVGQKLELVGFGGPLYGQKRSFYGERLPDRDFRINAASISGDSGSGILWGETIVGINYGGPGVAGLEPVQGQREPVELVYPATSGVSPRFLAQWIPKALTQCPGGICRPIFRDPMIGFGGYSQPVPSRPASPPQAFYNPPQATKPPATKPSAPVVPGLPGMEISPPGKPEAAPGVDPLYVMPIRELDLEKIKIEILAELRSEIPKAKAGERGPIGPTGPKGDKGDPGRIDPELVEGIVKRAISETPNGVINLEITDGFLFATFADGRRAQIGEVSSGGPAYFEIVPRDKR